MRYVFFGNEETSRSLPSHDIQSERSSEVENLGCSLF